MSKSKFKSASEFYCELTISLEANVEMLNDNVTESDIKVTILNGTKTENYRGG